MPFLLPCDFQLMEYELRTAREDLEAVREAGGSCALFVSVLAALVTVTTTGVPARSPKEILSPSFH